MIKKIISLILLLNMPLILAAPINAQPGTNLWHLLAAIGTETDIIQVTLTFDYAGTTTVLENLIATSTIIESKLDNLQTIVDQDFAGTFTALAAVNITSTSNACPCSPTQLTLTSSGTTLSVAGIYCLTNNVTLGSLNTIAITADFVTLDLNGHTITGGSGINSSNSNVTIKNGTLKTLTASATAVTLSSGNSDCIISDLLIDNCDNGIAVASNSNLHINDIKFTNNIATTVIGINCIDTTNAVIENCQINNDSGPFAAEIGLRIFNGVNITVLNCSTHNQRIGFLEDANSSVNIKPITFENCSSSQNAPSGVLNLTTGFQLIASAAATKHALQLSNCYSQSNDRGFDVRNDDSAGSIILENCQAFKAQVGFNSACRNTTLINCMVNTLVDFSLQGFNCSALNAKLSNCFALNYPSTGTGFIVSGLDSVISNCIAMAATKSSTIGFDTTSSAGATIELCTASNNNIGFNSSVTTIRYLNNGLANNSNFSAADPNSAPEMLLTSTGRLYGDNLVAPTLP